MTKTISWPVRVMYILIALALAIGLAMAAALPSSGDPAKKSKWDNVSTPSMKGKVILPGSDIYSFDMGPEGKVIYAVAGVPKDKEHPGGCALFKSKDGGVTWDDITDEVIEEGLEEFYLVSVAPDNADFVVVAGADKVLGSNDGGADFTDTLFPPNVGNITCLDTSSERGERYNIAVGTDKGVIWRYEAGAYWGGFWEDARYDGWKDSIWVTSVAFSPAFAGDDTILAITTDGRATYQQSGLWGKTKAWNAEVGSPFPEAVEIVDAPPLGPLGHTGIALPSDFTGYISGFLRYNWVYVNYNVDLSEAAPASFKEAFDAIGEVFCIKGSAVDYCGIQCLRYDTSKTYPLMASISMSGKIEDGNLMVGLAGPTDCCAGIQVYRTTEWPIDLRCPQWSEASKPPTGRSHALVAYTPDGTKAYVTTAGDPNDPTPYDESAFSVSQEGELGKYWNQLSLIDTNIDRLTDVAVNPACSTIYLFSVNEKGCGCDSVWYSTNNGSSYMRVFCQDLEGSPELGLIRLAPEEEEEVLTVYLVDRGTNKVYWNDNSGITSWTSHKAATLVDIMDLAVEAEDTIYAVDSKGKVSMSRKHGAPGSWSSAMSAKLTTNEAGHTIAVVDGHVLVGGNKGTVGYSDDGAASFRRLGGEGELGTDGEVHVAFDSYFKDNKTVYAAITGGEKGIWRWVIDDSTAWEDLKAYGKDETENVTDYYGIVLDNAAGNPKTSAANGGVLYAAYATGVARWLSPCGTPEAEEWDYLTIGVPATFTAEPSSLRICGCLTADTNTLLRAINTSDYDLDEGKNNLFVYEDCLSKASVALSKVADGAVIPSDPCVCRNESFVLEWEKLCNSQTYELEIALDEDFRHRIPKYNPCIVDKEYKLVEEGDLDCNETYYWRVRVIKAGAEEEIRSWWSETWSFMVEAGPVGAIQLTAPKAGATGVVITGIGFTWTSVAGADSYDWVLSPNADLSSPIETKTGLTGTAYTYTGTLDYETSYFWQVKAMKAGSVLSASPIFTFTTMAEPVPPPELVIPPPVTPAWVWVVIGTGAVLVIVIIVLIFRTRRV